MREHPDPQHNIGKAVGNLKLCLGWIQIGHSKLGVFVSLRFETVASNVADFEQAVGVCVFAKPMFIGYECEVVGGLVRIGLCAVFGQFNGLCDDNSELIE